MRARQRRSAIGSMADPSQEACEDGVTARMGPARHDSQHGGRCFAYALLINSPSGCRTALEYWNG